MTLDELVKLYNDKSWHPNIHMHPDEKAGIRAVVEALRDEIDIAIEAAGAWAEQDAAEWFNEILASDGEVKAELPKLQTKTVPLTGITKTVRPDLVFEPDEAAGGPTRETGQGCRPDGARPQDAQSTPAAAPTADDWLSLVKGTSLEPYSGTSETRGILFTETKPEAAPVCEWTFLEVVEGVDSYHTNHGQTSRFKSLYGNCIDCGKPISFKSEAAR